MNGSGAPPKQLGSASKVKRGLFAAGAPHFAGDDFVECFDLSSQNIAHGVLKHKGDIGIGVRLLRSKGCTREVERAAWAEGVITPITDFSRMAEVCPTIISTD